MNTTISLKFPCLIMMCKDFLKQISYFNLILSIQFILFLTLSSFEYILWHQGQCFYGIRECSKNWVFVTVSVSFVFSCTLFLLAVCFVQSQCIVFYYYFNYLLEFCQFPNKRQKKGCSGWEGRWRGTGRNSGKENNQDKLLNKNIFSVKIILNKKILYVKNNLVIKCH